MTALVMFMLILSAREIVAFGCGYCLDRDDERNFFHSYPYDPDGDTIKMMLVFVGFPADGIDARITYDMHGQYLQTIDDWLQTQSFGALSLHEDSMILLPQGASGIGPDDPESATWAASLATELYQSRDSLPQDYAFWHLEDWWTHDDGYAAPLFAEIMEQIYLDYQGSGLFDDVTGSTRGWRLQFFFLNPWDNSTPFEIQDGQAEGVEGRPDIPLFRSIGQTLFGDFFDNLDTGLGAGGYDIYGGTGQIGAAAGMGLPLHPLAYVFPWIHEVVHTLGPPDGPPNLYTDLEIEERYFYGNLNIICQHAPHLDCASPAPFRGIAPLADPWLARMPWNDGIEQTGPVAVDFTNTSFRDLELEDVALGGQIYRYSAGTYSEGGQDDEEYFVIAYHGGGGLDDQSQYGGEPCVPSQGLAIWHCVGQKMFDLEAAHGLFNYKDLGMQEFVPWWEEPPGLAPQIENGFDNYDAWLWGSGPNDYRTDYCTHTGYPSDFFQLNQDDPHLEKTLFNWSSNPSTALYDPNDSETTILRRKRQRLYVNPMVVEIVGEQNGNLVVDLLHAPSERLAHDVPAIVQVGQSSDWTWQTRWADKLDLVNVWYSNDDGGEYRWHVGVDIPYDPQNPTFTWTPAAEHGSEFGKLRFEFRNTMMPERIGYFETPTSFEVRGGYVDVKEQITSPNGGEILYVDGPTDVRWTNFFGDNMQIQIEQVDLEYSTDGGSSYTPWRSFTHGGLHPWYYDDETHENYVSVTPTEDMAGEACRFRLRFHYQGRTTEDDSDADFAIYPRALRFVPETAAETHLDYLGKPYGAVAIQATADDKLDLVVTIVDDLGAPDASSEFYENIGDPEGPVRFDVRTQYRFAGGDEPGTGFESVVAGDVDGDGIDDLMMTHAANPALYVDNGAGEWLDVSTDSDWFTQDDQALLASSERAVLVDYDHDGDLDLYVGRDTAPDAMFENRGASPVPRFVHVNGPGSTTFPEMPAVQTRDIAWCDYDEDGLWNVVIVIYSIGSFHRLFLEEVAAGVYAEQTEGIPSYPVQNLPMSEIEFCDLDRDLDFDLIALKNRYVWTSMNDDVGWSLTSQQFPYVDIFGFGHGDLNLDGLPDIMLFGDDPAVMGLGVASRPEFLNAFLPIMDSAGIPPATESANALALADFNQDGDLDAFLGRYDGPDGIRVLRATDLDGSEVVRGRSITVSLVGHEDNAHGIGAVVSLTRADDGTPLGMQYVSGEGDHGGQNPHALVFGVGDYTGAVDIRVRWPLGRLQDITVPPGTENATVEIEESVGFAIDYGSITFTMITALGGDVHWRFEWDTDHWTDYRLDQVSIAADPEGCIPEGAVLVHGDPGVTATVTYTVGEDTPPYFHHVLEYTDAPCDPSCEIEYSVGSNNGMWVGLVESGPQLGCTPKICPVNQ